MPAGIDCAPTCSIEFEQGTAITLGAQASPGHSFVGWAGDECSGTGLCNLVLNAAAEIEAVFQSDTPRIPLSVTVTGGGRVSSLPAGIDCPTDCVTEFDQNTVVELFALADPGFTFVGWANACSGSGPCSVTLDAAREVDAVFSANTPRFDLELNRIGDGFVGSTPAGIQCGADCAASFVQGALVELFPAAASGWRFSHWSGACSGSGACNVTMDGDRQVTSTFIEQIALTVAVDGDGRVVSDPAGIDCGADCGAAFDRDTVVTLTAIPDPGWVIAEWIGTSCPLGTACTLVLDQARSVTARFAPAGDLLFRDGFE